MGEEVILYSSEGQVSAATIMTGEILAGGGNDSMYVSSGGTAVMTAVNSGGYMFVSSGGTAVQTTIESGGEMYVYGGIANGTTVNSGGVATILAGPEENIVCTTVNSGGSAYLYATSEGSIIYNTIINESGYATIGGSANHTTVDSGGVVSLFLGPARDNRIESGGSLVVGERGSAVQNTIYSGGSITILDRGQANETTLEGGFLAVQLGGKADYTEISDKGKLMLFGEADNTVIRYFGTMFVLGGSVAENITVDYEGSVYVATGGEIKGDISISQSGGLYLYGGSIVDGEIHAQGTLYVDETMVNNGHITIDLNEASPSLAMIQNLDYMTGTENFTVETAAVGLGSYSLASGADQYDGTVTVSSNNSELGTISVGETLFSNDMYYSLYSSDDTLMLGISDAAPNEEVKLYSSGEQVSAASIMTGEILAGGGNDWMAVSSGGTAVKTAVNSGGSMDVYEGGIANSTTIQESGYVNIMDGGIASNTIISGGTSSYDGTHFYPVCGYMNVNCGGTATNTTIQSCGYMGIYDGGTATGTTVKSGGTMYVNSGGTATNIIAEKGATLGLWVTSDTYIQGKCNGSAFEMKDAFLSGYTVYSSGMIYVESDGVAEDTVVSGGYAFVCNGGILKNTILNSSGYLSVDSGGTATGINIKNEGQLYVMSGGTATDIVAVKGAGLGITVAQDTYMQGKYNGSAFEMKDGILSGIKTVYNEASVNVADGGIVSDIIIESSGYLSITSGGSATNITAKKGARIQINVASDTYLQGTSDGTALKMEDAVLSGFIVNSKSYVNVESGAAATDTTINSKGWVAVNGGTVKNTVVNNGGNLQVYNGTISGTLTIADDAKVYCYSYSDYSGAGEEVEAYTTIDFTVAEQSNPKTALINNWSLIDGGANAAYTLTVKTNQEEGDYLLAGKAGYFAKTITVKTVEGNELGEIFVGGSLDANNIRYTLTEEKGNLQLSIQDNSPVPTPISSTTKSIEWTQVEGCEKYIVQYSNDNFKHSIEVSTSGTQLETCGIPKGEWQWKVRTETSNKWQLGETISKTTSHTTPEAVSAQENGVSDIFFLASQGKWERNYSAQHVGSGSWQGTGETVCLEGKNRFSDTITGNADLNLLVLTDDKNGDALFVDDIFTAFPDEQQSRIAQIKEIHAGAGNDIIDMTSQLFEYNGDGLTIRGGTGDDVIWANHGENMLFGDAGEDQIVGASDDDIIVGGSGNDEMHGGGGNDIFTFGKDWGSDTVEQLEDGTVTLWFASGSEDKWDAETLTYKDGANEVKVTGVTNDQISLKFGEAESSEKFAELIAAGAFRGASSENAFEEPDKGIIVSL